MNQEILTTALRAEAAKALSDAAYEVSHKSAGLAEVREHVARAIQALEMSLPMADRSINTLVMIGR